MTPRRPSASRALSRSLRARHLQPWEESTAALARRLAFELDQAEQAEDVARLSGRYLAALAALGMTRPTRQPTAREESDGAPASITPLERIRAARARQRDPTTVDPPPA